MNLPHCILIAAACLSLAACEKHQEPIGTVPADDVPAVPAGERGSTAGQDADVDSSACERQIGAEREACLRRYPPATTTPVEPQRSPPPPAD
jgi:hypothetical protein